MKTNEPIPTLALDDLLHMAASAIEDLLEHTDPNTSYYSGVWADVPGKLRAAAMLQAGNSPAHSGLRPEQNIGSPAQSPIDHGNSPVIPDGSADMLRRWLAFGRGMQNAGCQLPHNLIVESEAMLAAAQHDTPALNPVQSVVTVPGKWIPVSERMPELGDWLVTDGCDFDVQLFNGEQFIPGFVWEDKITHWMPLPAVPQEVK